MLGNTYDLKTRTWRADGNTLIGAQEFWFALGMTVLCVYYHSFLNTADMYNSVIIPWFTVREVSVDVEIVRWLFLLQ